MQTAFVAGATGYTGQYVVEQLVGRGVTTVAHIRPDSPRLLEWRDRFEALGSGVDSCAWEPEMMRETLCRLQPTLVFALLGTTRARMGDLGASGGDPASASYEAVDYGMTMMVLEASLAAESSPRFVYLSAAGVSSTSPGAYLRARWRVEQEVLASGLPYTIARPSFITGPDREESRPAERIASVLSDGALTVAGWMGATVFRERYRSISGASLGDALVQLSMSPDAENRIVGSEGLRS